MRVLLVNKFYYPRGGDCLAMMRTERLLSEHGHDVAVFAMACPENSPHPDSGLFASQVRFDGSTAEKARAFGRMMGWGDIRRSFNRVLDRFRPEVVHLNNIHSYLSPVVATLAHKRGCRVVWTLHDYKLFCPAYTCLRGNGEPCRACIGAKRQVVTHRCMKNSRAASVAAWVEAKRWSRDRIEPYVDRWICPSEYMASQMTQAGFDPAKMTVINNFIQTPPTAGTPRGDYACYVGRLSREKGLTDMVRAAAKALNHLVIAGSGPEEDALRDAIKASGSQTLTTACKIEMPGRLDPDQAQRLLAGARFSVLPAIWPENNPLAVVESLTAGTPVVGTDIGGIPELIDADSGIIVPPGDAQALAEAFAEANTRQWDHDDIARRAKSRFGPDTHYSKLMEVYNANQR